MNRRMRTLETQIEAIKRELAKLGALRPGSLTQQYNVCGSPGCACKANPPRKHGPYYQLSYTRKGKGGTRFVKKEDVTDIKEAMKNYARLRSLVERWIDLATELSDLRLEHRAAADKKARRR